MQESLLQRLRALILEQADGEGFLPSGLPDVILMRMDRCLPLAPTVYEPCILVVAQGSKVGVVGGRRYAYDAERCLVLTLPLPFESETIGSREEPFLAMAVRLTPSVVTELLVLMDRSLPHEDGDHEATGVPVDTDILAAAVRLADNLRSAERARILGPSVIRELVYLLLQGPAGAGLAGLAAGHDQRWRIGKIVQRLHRDYAAQVDVRSLAREAGMSPSAFHARFKGVTGATPLHYQKLIRLHKARDLMVNEGSTAQRAALEVGYESASQFSREFRRLFGDSPGGVAAKLRKRLDDSQGSRLSMTLSFS